MSNDTNERLVVLEAVSITLHQALQGMLETLRASRPGEAGREFSVRLTIDLPSGLPSTIRPPDLAKQVRPPPPHRIRAGGMTAEYPAVAVAKVVAMVTVFGSRGETPTAGMHRSIWYLETDEARERRAQEQCRRKPVVRT